MPRRPGPDAMTIRAFYERWPQYNRRLTEVVAAMTDEQLAIRPSPERDPIWATVGHTRRAGVLAVRRAQGARRARRRPGPTR